MGWQVNTSPVYYQHVGHFLTLTVCDKLLACEKLSSMKEYFANLICGEISHNETIHLA